MHRPMRLVLLMQANGVSQQRFWPDASGSSPILDPILSDPRLKARTTVVKGLFNHSGGAENQHDQGFAGLWTGRPSTGTFFDPWGRGPFGRPGDRAERDARRSFPDAELRRHCVEHAALRGASDLVRISRRAPADPDRDRSRAALRTPLRSGRDAGTRAAAHQRGPFGPRPCVEGSRTQADEPREGKARQARRPCDGHPGLRASRRAPRRSTAHRRLRRARAPAGGHRSPRREERARAAGRNARSRRAGDLVRPRSYRDRPDRRRRAHVALRLARHRRELAR